ncbi:hypothetical protein ACT453_44260, partial [Bacillus sp. D-CC]
SFSNCSSSYASHKNANVTRSAPKEDFNYIDPQTNERYVPYCIEPSLGADRVTLAFLCDAYEEEQLENDSRTVLRFHPALAPSDSFLDNGKIAALYGA